MRVGGGRGAGVSGRSRPTSLPARAEPPPRLQSASCPQSGQAYGRGRKSAGPSAPCSTSYVARHRETCSSTAVAALGRRFIGLNRSPQNQASRGGTKFFSKVVVRAVPEGNGEGAYVPFPFDENEYIEVAMQLLHPNRVAGEVQQATLILYSREGNFLDLLRDQNGDEDGEDAGPSGAPPAQGDENMAILSKIKDEKCLVVEIGGDTVSNISATLESTQFTRPLALDLLWQVLQRGQAISKSDWGLARVAIVDLRGGTFIGRLFFGDRDAGKIYWDCDCRPSDGVWLALQSKCPVFVSKAVWNLAAVPLSKVGARELFSHPSLLDTTSPDHPDADPLSSTRSQLVVSNQDQDAEAEGPFFAEDEGFGQDQSDASMPGMGLKNGDPEPIKRLKRELQVALAEEDYAAAIRIRDHPFMVLYSEIEARRSDGDEEEAEILSEELRRAINESGEPED